MKATTEKTLEAVNSEPLRSSGRAMPKLMHLQILRALAATLVVVDHSIAALAYQGIPVTRYMDAAVLCGHMGVAAFFALSGLIMVRQSAGRFAVAGSSLRFLYHRITRIVPMYWLATAVWFIAKRWVWHNRMPHVLLQLTLSLTFLPNWYNPESHLSPILEPGWTLNYEMAFYLLFGLCLLLPRRIGISAVVVCLVAFARAGAHGAFAASGWISQLLNYYSNGIILMFAFGVLVGAIEIWIDRPARASWRISPAFFLLIPSVILMAFPDLSHAAGLAVWLGWYSAAVVALCTVINLDRTEWVNRGLILLGDASYSTYLFHLWAPTLLFPLLFRTRLFYHGLGVVLGSVVAASALGVAVHLAVERPLMRTLRGRA